MAKKIKSKDTYALESGGAENGVMSPLAFRRWRKSLKLSQKAAAEALGLKRRVVQYYEKGERDGVPVVIPKTVRLACYALADGQMDYPGPEDG
jgi:DNA-binding XRE family transcriptional regulator